MEFHQNRNPNEMQANAEDAVEVIVENLNEFTAKAPIPQQILIGSVAGWTVGYVGFKVGKTALFVVGVGMIPLQFAIYKGYITVNWPRILGNEENVERGRRVNVPVRGASSVITKIRRLFVKKVYFTGSFVTALFIGIGCA